MAIIAMAVVDIPPDFLGLLLFSCVSSVCSDDDSSSLSSESVGRLGVSSVGLGESVGLEDFDDFVFDVLVFVVDSVLVLVGLGSSGFGGFGSL
ncbi:hypothetical protein GGF41_002693, partial [Coemansia sp. RSA 2531]